MEAPNSPMQEEIPGRLLWIQSRSFDPYWNLALEEHLLFRCGEADRILYLWQNEKTVVIGRNQNTEQECPVKLLERDGVHLARRNSGGGAVYHDLGNLNFSFLTREADYDVGKQTQAVLDALRSLRIDAEYSGRNDVVVNGRKVSGSAFFKSGGFCCHHGTLMMDVDLDAADRYLHPAADKLAARGVTSVHARVANLRDIRPEIRIEDLGRALLLACEHVFRQTAGSLILSPSDEADVQQRRKRFADPRWIFGETMNDTPAISQRFSWGGITLHLRVSDERIIGVQVETDAMDPELPEILRQGLTDVRFETRTLSEAVARCRFSGRQGEQIRTDLAEWLAKRR